ncbi:MAG TPA: transposase [bacterium]|nr:transposase [bacterium]HQL61757.1 transposase [bacterium]
MATESRTDWHHSPLHVFRPGATFIVTAGTLHKERLFRDDERLRLLEESLFEVTDKYGWQVEAWAIFSNHYHFVAQSSEEIDSLRRMVRRLHSVTAIRLNQFDGTKGRQVWFQYWDTCLTYEKSYYARLNYVHNNPVKHGIVAVAEQYPFCSANWFKNEAEDSFRRKVESFGFERVNVRDDF